MEVNFDAAAGTLAGGAMSGEVQARIAKNDWSNFDETDDYSYNAAYNSSFTSWENVTLYCNGVLAWGIEPISTPSTKVKLHALLEGAYTGSGQMTTTANSILELNQPFNRAPWYYNGTESVSSMPNNVVDWVLVELQNAVDGSTALSAALLLNDGSIVASDWTNDPSIDGVFFEDLNENQLYHIVLRHRNHLAVIGATAISLPNSISYDFRDATNVMGSNQVVDLGDGYHALKAGDWNSDGVISVADYNGYLIQIAAINQYVAGDFNLDGNVTVADFNLYFPDASVIGMPGVRY